MNCAFSIRTENEFYMDVQQLADAILNNTLAADLRVTSSNVNAVNRALAEAVLHFKIVMHGMRDNGLAGPLLLLIRNATAMSVRQCVLHYCVVWSCVTCRFVTFHERSEVAVENCLEVIFTSLHKTLIAGINFAI